ncbi:uncharacterized protein CLUP02_12126 [Colletotrichum lupini]|uniref:Uncharacterized protein n=1 Tax=Colletotrichum lupini TaxID=145971 RepID=A0A9Q8SZR5_9PEZI|nr:uncharacterized protein CLUP02_12126 [Colletotrichum lupini]UQC86624.1 hypothetical protein CLUP02_12126 [Colletotrichum lupini]
MCFHPIRHESVKHDEAEDLRHESRGTSLSISTKAIKNDARQDIHRNFAAEAPFKRETQRPKNPFWETDVDGIAKRVESSSKKKAEWLYVAALSILALFPINSLSLLKGQWPQLSVTSLWCAHKIGQTPLTRRSLYLAQLPNTRKKPLLPIRLEHDHEIHIMNPSANFGDADIVISRGGLQDLFDFARGKSQKSFRVEFDLVNTTLFIAWRKENNSFRMYDAGLESSVSHQRVIQYNIGEMKCLVRHEVDGAHYGPEENATENDADVEAPPSVIQSTPQKNTLNGKAGISSERRATHRGQETSPSVIMELKARPRMEAWDTMNQMYFGRTPHLVIGQHEKGEFTGVRMEDCEPLMEKWEWENHVALTKLASLLGLLRENTKRSRAQGSNRLSSGVREDILDP